MYKYLIFLIIILLYSPAPVFASLPSFVTPAFPIRGAEFWPLSDQTQTPYTNFQNLHKLIKDNDLPAVWLFRYDALQDSKITTTAKLLPENQQRGLFLEITPSLAHASQVEYPKGDNWSDARRVFISGYSLEERIKLINTSMSEFLKIYGHFPSTVAAWHIDAWTANYLSRQFGINSVIICSDQYATDRYQIWGGWWGVPYYPSKNNILTPAQSLKYKLPLIVTHWAARDPKLGYGGSVQQSTYSIQANDYLLHNLDINYFEYLLNIYTQNPSNQFGYLLIGIENDYNWNQYKSEISRQLAIIKQYQAENKLTATTVSEFSRWYQQTFPETSPKHIITDQNTTWEMTTQYRLGYQHTNNSLQLIDYRVYDQKFSESFLETKNQFSNLHLVVSAQNDSITFPNQAQIVTPKKLDQLRQPQQPTLPFQPNINGVIVWYTILVGILIYLNIVKFINHRTTALLIVGSITISLPLLKSGLLYPYGMGFWGPNGHDGIWHLALIEHFTRYWNLDSPILANTRLTNYHFLFDLLLALANKLTPGISAVTLYFQIIPPFMALILGILTWKFMLAWTKSPIASYLALILIYFGGGFGWLINFYRNKPLDGESMFWSTQAISTLINPPFTLSLILLLIGLILLNKYLNSKSITYPILPITFGILVHAKSYAGILALGSLAILSVFEIFSNISSIHKAEPRPKNYKITKLLITSSLISVLTLIPITKFTGQTFFEFKPLWFPRAMLLFEDRFHWLRLYQAIQAYWDTGNWLKGVLADGLAIAIFYLGNLGIRVIGIWVFISVIPPLYKRRLIKVTSQNINNPNNQTKKIRKFETSKLITYYLLLITLLSALIPLFFTQTATPWNTIQFLYYTIFLMSLFTAKVISEWLKNKPKLITYSLLLIILIFNLPTTIGTLKHYLPYRAPSRIPYEELSALEFLRLQPPGRVLTHPFREDEIAQYEAPKPLANYISTAYVSAFSSHPVYLEDEINLDITGAPWQTAHQQSQRFFSTLNEQTAREFISQNQIQYLYVLKSQEPNLPPEQLNFSKIFDNGLVKIYHLNQYQIWKTG